MTLIGCRCKDGDVKAEHYQLPKTFFGSPASRVWRAGTGDSDFELCILLEEEKFYHVLLVEIRHLIRLTSQ